MKKFILYVFVAVGIVAGGAAAYLWVNLDNMVKTAIERDGSEKAKTKVTVASVNISPFSGKGSIKGLKVANPPGFNKENAVEVDSATIVIDLKSLRGPHLVIDQISIDKPRLNVQAENGEVNLLQLQKNLESSETKPSGNAEEAKPKKERKVVIGLFEVIGAKVHVEAVSRETGGKTLDLEPVKLKNIGQQQGGVTTAEASHEITEALVKSAKNSVAQAGKEAVKGKAKGAAQDLINQTVEGLRQKRVSLP
jgi:uncharacterized protein involved in outer membrane biogenesis